MRLREILVYEDDGGASVATTSADIATVAYPLLVRGKTNKEKRKNARAAVGQKMDNAPSYIGQGVYENQADKKCPPATQDITLNLKNRQKAINEYGYGPLNPDLPNTKFWMAKVDEWNLDSAKEAKSSVCGNCAAFDQRTNTLNCIAQGIGSDSGEQDPTVKAGDLGYCRFLKFKCASRRTCDAWVVGGPLKDKLDVEEAHTLNSNNVIYRLDTENPMSDTEVLVLGGAGRYSLKGLRDKARREAQALANDLEIEHGGAFRRSAENVKQLTNTLNTIVAAYNELKRIRSKGGRGSRGITDEDTNFINECMSIVEQWKSKVQEKAPPGFDASLEKKLLNQYKDEPSRAYATMWSIYNKQKRK